jgi:hypothetical protein
MKHHKHTINTLVALGLIAAGLLFFMDQLFGFDAWSVIWPMLVIAPGLPFLYVAWTTEDNNLTWLAVPGSLITGTGLILLYQSVTGHWESWAYVWTLYGVFLGTALLYAGERNHEKEVQQVGYGFVMFSGLSFLVLGIFFELFVFDGFLRRFLLASVLMSIGVWLILRDDDYDGKKAKRKRHADAPLDDLDYVVASVRTDGEITPTSNGKANAPVIVTDRGTGGKNGDSHTGHSPVRL